MAKLIHEGSTSLPPDDSWLQTISDTTRVHRIALYGKRLLGRVRAQNWTATSISVCFLLSCARSTLLSNHLSVDGCAPSVPRAWRDPHASSIEVERPNYGPECPTFCTG